jgi:hypothetical protein
MLPAVSEMPSSYQLSAQDRIAALEAELFNLHVCHQPKFVPTIKTRKQRAAEKMAAKETEGQEEGEEEEEEGPFYAKTT